MQVDGYKIANLNDFDALGVPQAYYEVDLQYMGKLSFMICKWIDYGVLINKELIFPGLNDVNPRAMKNNVIWFDSDRNVWWGQLLDED